MPTGKGVSTTRESTCTLRHVTCHVRPTAVSTVKALFHLGCERADLFHVAHTFRHSPLKSEPHQMYQMFVSFMHLMALHEELMHFSSKERHSSVQGFH